MDSRGGSGSEKAGQASEFLFNGGKFRLVEGFCLGPAALPKLAEGFGGDGAGVMASGQNAAPGATPALAADTLAGVKQRLLEEEIPLVFGGGLA